MHNFFQSFCKKDVNTHYGSLLKDISWIYGTIFSSCEHAFGLKRVGHYFHQARPAHNTVSIHGRVEQKHFM
jgi:hypothetical protein